MARKGYPAEFRRRALDLVAAGEQAEDRSSVNRRGTCRDIDSTKGLEPVGRADTGSEEHHVLCAWKGSAGDDQTGHVFGPHPRGQRLAGSVLVVDQIGWVETDAACVLERHLEQPCLLDAKHPRPYSQLANLPGLTKAVSAQELHERPERV